MKYEINRKLFHILRQLGFTELESRTYLEVASYYLEVLKNPHSKRKLLSFDEEVVGRLQKLGMLFISKDHSGQNTINISDPRIASRAIYSNYLWSLFPSENLLNNLSDSEKAKIISFKLLCFEFESYFGGLYAPLVSSEGVVMIAEEAISGELAMCLRSANKTIRGITIPNWTPDISLVWETIKDRISAGVSYKRLADEITLISFGYMINKRDIEEIGVDLRILPRDIFQEKFFLIDDNIAFVFWPPIPNSNFLLEASITTMPTFVSHYERHFNSLWEQAIPVKTLLPDIGFLKNTFIRMCENEVGKSIRNTAELLFDYGKFCFKANGSPDYGIDRNEINELLKRSLVIPCSGDYNAMIPNITSQVRGLITGISKQKKRV